jgi:hypothetical protein
MVAQSSMDEQVGTAAAPKRQPLQGRTQPTARSLRLEATVRHAIRRTTRRPPHRSSQQPGHWPIHTPVRRSGHRPARRPTRRSAATRPPMSVRPSRRTTSTKTSAATRLARSCRIARRTERRHDDGQPAAQPDRQRRVQAEAQPDRWSNISVRHGGIAAQPKGQPTRSLSAWRSSITGNDATARWAGAPG